jgi:hypothetical protein
MDQRAVIASGRTWPEEVNAFAGWIRDTYPAFRWRHLSFFERPLGRPRPERAGWTCFDPETFEPRFYDILKEVDRDWINLECETIKYETLIVSVLWHEAREPIPFTYWPPELEVKAVHVNWSGFDENQLEALLLDAGVVGEDHDALVRRLFDEAEALASEEEWRHVVARMRRVGAENLSDRELAILNAWDAARLSADCL